MVGRSEEECDEAFSRLCGALPAPASWHSERLRIANCRLSWWGNASSRALIGVEQLAGNRVVGIAIDGVITNLASISEGLGCDGKTAVHTIAQAYAVCGIRIAKKLEGSFALAICDPLRNVTQLVRDPLGTVPLYWGQLRNGLSAFASLPLSVCDSLGIASELSQTAVRRELLGLPTLAPDTMFTAVKSVEPGGIVSLFHAGGTRSERYFALEQLVSATCTEDSLVARMRDGIAQGVACGIDNMQGQIAVALSGGLDSSVVVGASSQTARDRIRAVTAVASGSAQADRDYAQHVVDHCGVDWTCYDSRDIVTPDYILAKGHNPIAMANAGFAAEVFRYALKMNCGTILTGAMGDLVGGAAWNWGVAMLWSGEIRRLYREEAVAFARRPVQLLRSLAGSTLRYFRHRTRFDKYCADVFRGDAYFLRQILDLVGACGDVRKGLEEEVWDYYYRQNVPEPDYGAWLAWHIRNGGHQELESFAVLGRLMGLETGFPLAHPMVVSSALSLPWGLRRSQGRSRVALRAAAYGWIPEAVTARQDKLLLTDHFLQMWRCELGQANTGELLLAASTYADQDALLRLFVQFERLPEYMVRTLHNVRTLGRWVSLNKTRAGGIKRGSEQ